MELLKRIRARIKEHNVSMVAAGVAFYSLMAIFPTIIAAVTLYALLSDPTQVDHQLAPVVHTLPSDAGRLLTDQLTRAVDANHGGLTVGLIISLLGSLWAASGGVNAVMTALGIIFEASGRSAVKQRALSLGLTLGAMVVALVTLALIAIFPVVLNHVGLGTAGKVLAEVLRWVLLLALIGAGLALLYRVAANRPEDRWRFVSRGAAGALLIWIIGSVGFSLYVSNFGKYGTVYGSLAAVVVLLLWLYLSSFAVLLGAVVDAEIAAGRSPNPPPAEPAARPPSGPDVQPPSGGPGSQPPDTRPSGPPERRSARQPATG